MLIALIAAVADNQVIGRANQLPWQLPDDLAHFRRLTAGKPIIMGRKTYDSIGRPLPKRLNIVLTRDPTFAPAGVVIAHTPEAALRQAATAPEVMIIGGAALYQQFLPLAHRIYLTRVHAAPAGDAHFPLLDATGWRRTSAEAHPADDRHTDAFTFELWEK